MPVPEGYVYKDGAYWNLTDASGPYGISPTGAVVPLSGFAYSGVWANRPIASSVPARTKIAITDVGVGGYSEWFSDGTYWKPVNGSLLLFRDRGTVAAPLATITGDGVLTIATFAIPNAASLLIPAGMCYPGSRIVVIHEGFRGATATVSYNLACKLEPGLTAVANTPLTVINLPATANVNGRTYGAATIVDDTSIVISRAVNFGTNATGFNGLGSGNFDSAPPYVVFYVQGTALPVGETISLLSYQVYFEA